MPLTSVKTCSKGSRPAGCPGADLDFVVCLCNNIISLDG